MRRLHWVVTRPSGRLVGRYGFRTRIATEEWDPVPLSPVASVPLIAPAPLLLVHGDRDPYFPLDHPRMLAEAAGPGGAELWLERGMGHAENAADDALLARSRRLGRRAHRPRDPSWGADARGVRRTDRPKEWRHGSGDDPLLGRGEAAAGTAEEPYAAATLAEALDAVRERHPGELSQVLRRCSFLVDGDPVGTREHETARLAEGGIGRGAPAVRRRVNRRP